MVRGRCPRSTGRQFTTTCSASVRSGLRGSLLLLLVGVLQCHCVMVWTVSTFLMKAYIAASLVTAWSFGSSDIAGRIDPRASFCLLALTEKLCHFYTSLLFTCSDGFLSLVIVTCFAMSDAIARLIIDAPLLHCTRAAVPTLLNFADQSF